MTAAELDRRDLVRSLRGRLCPLCGGCKGALKVVCFPCWKGIPKRLRDQLDFPVGRGFEEAVAELCTWRGVSAASLRGGPGAGTACLECGGLGAIVRDDGVETACPTCYGGPS